MAQKKTTNKKAPSKRTPAAKREVSEGLRKEIWIFVLLAVTAILFLGSFNMAGSFGEALYRFQHGLFGTLGYVFPFLFFGAAIYLMISLKKYGPVAIAITVVGFAAFLLLCGIFEFINGKGMLKALPLSEYYKQGTEGFNGGLFGGMLFKLLHPALGMLGSYAVLVIAEVVCIVFITGKSILSPLKKGGKRIVESTKNGVVHYKQDRDARNEQREERIRARQEERLRRQEAERERLKNRATGVELEGTDLMKPFVDDRSGRKEDKKVRRPGYVEDVSQETSLTVEEALESMPGPVIGDDPNAPYLKNNKKKIGLDKVLDRVEKKEAEKKAGALAPGAAEQPKGTPAGTAEAGKGAVAEPQTAGKPGTYIAGRDTRTLSELEALDHPEAGQSGRRKAGGPADTDPGSTWSAGKGSGIYVSGVPTKGERPDGTIPEFSDETEASVPDWYEYNDPEETLPEELLESLDPADALRQLSGELPGKEQAKKPSASGQQSIWSTGGSDRESTAGKAFTGSGNAQAAYKTAGKMVTGGITTPGVAKPIVKKDYKAPALSLLTLPDGKKGNNREELAETAQTLVETLRNFGVNVEVTDISCGPAVTRYELHPEQGVKVSRIVALADDIKLNLAAADIRIEAPIPGKAAVGIEVPNKENNTVYLREILKSEAFTKATSKLTVGIGLDIGGDPVIADLAKMPHVLIAGATGSGKSVCINTLIVSILYKASPEEVRFIMIDPKKVELSVYNGIPHLLTPVVTDPKKAAAALNWAVAEMTDRYQRFADFAVRDIKSYNRKLDDIRAEKEASGLEVDPDLPEKMSQIVIVVDELADLMMVSPAEVEEAICRIAQLARAAGIHLVIATQRPSVNVITGLIKANVPSRIAFSVASGIDSRTILDMVGAEKLLGKGDMLFYPMGYNKPVRVQGAFVTDEEVEKVVQYISNQRLTPGKGGSLEESLANAGRDGSSALGSERDDLFEQCGRFIIEKDKGTIGNLQRAFRIGFNRAARIMDQLCEAGVVGPEEGTKPRQVLMTKDEFEEYVSQM